MKKIAVIQSNYLPWKGYFDIIRSVDEFVILDEVQYTRRDWRNRNVIYGEQGRRWITVPVETRGRYTQKINETRISGSGWADKHWHTVTRFYRRAAFFDDYSESFSQAWQEASKLEYLSDVNLLFIRLVNEILCIKTVISSSDKYPSASDRNGRLISICRQAGASHYLSGEAARAYLDVERFNNEGIEVLWADYSGYKPYIQLTTPFLHQVSIIDLIFNTGPDYGQHLRNL